MLSIFIPVLVIAALLGGSNGLAASKENQSPLQPAALAPISAMTTAVDLVLTAEFCANKTTKGAFLAGTRESFAVGKLACSELSANLAQYLTNVRTLEEPPSGLRSTALTLTPRYVDLGTALPAMLWSKKELSLYIEWTVEDAQGKTLWVQTVEGVGRKASIKFVSGPFAKRLIAPAMQDLTRNLMEQLLANPGVKLLLQPGAGT